MEQCCPEEGQDCVDPLHEAGRGQTCMGLCFANRNMALLSCCKCCNPMLR